VPKVEKNFWGGGEGQGASGLAKKFFGAWAWPPLAEKGPVSAPQKGPREGPKKGPCKAPWGGPPHAPIIHY